MINFIPKPVPDGAEDVPIHMNCLICRHCKLTPNSDLAQPNAAIFCEKRGQILPLIVSGCAIADERPYYVRKLCIGGDQLRNYHAVADAYLKANYNRLPMARLCAALRRPQAGVYHRASRLGLSHGARSVTRGARAWKKRASRRVTWTDKQIEWLRGEFNGPHWPGGGVGGNCATSIRERNNQQKARIVAEVAVRGEMKKWKTISSKCLTLFTPRGQKAEAAKNAKKIETARARRRQSNTKIREANYVRS